MLAGPGSFCSPALIVAIFIDILGYDAARHFATTVIIVATLSLSAAVTHVTLIAIISVTKVLESGVLLID